MWIEIIILFLKTQHNLQKKAHFQKFICMKKKNFGQKECSLCLKFVCTHIFQVFTVNFQIDFKITIPWGNDLVIEFPCTDDFPS